ncbi:mRNA turnover protein 4 [Nymphon striatum]|nr:mRNA turnover protein 4 [Nymphon striatum]
MAPLSLFNSEKLKLEKVAIITAHMHERKGSSLEDDILLETYDEGEINAESSSEKTSRSATLDSPGKVSTKTGSGFFFGKNKVMGFALGKTPEDEYRDNLSKITENLIGQCGLLMTNSNKKEVIEWFDSFSELDYARSGNKALETVVLEAGPLEQFSHAMEPHLRKLGLPTKLDKGNTIFLNSNINLKNVYSLNPPAFKPLLPLNKAIINHKFGKGLIEGCHCEN